VWRSDLVAWASGPRKTMDWIQNIQKDFNTVSDALNQLSLDRLQEDPDAFERVQRTQQDAFQSDSFQQRLLQNDHPLRAQKPEQASAAAPPARTPASTPVKPAAPPAVSAAASTPESQLKKRFVEAVSASRPGRAGTPEVEELPQRHSYEEPEVHFDEIGLEGRQGQVAPSNMNISLGERYKRTPRRPDEEWRVRAEAAARAEEEKRAKAAAEKAAKALEEERARAEKQKEKQQKEALAMERLAGPRRLRSETESPEEGKTAVQSKDERDPGPVGREGDGEMGSLRVEDTVIAEQYAGRAEERFSRVRSVPGTSTRQRSPVRSFGGDPYGRGSAQGPSAGSGTQSGLTTLENTLLARMRGYQDSAAGLPTLSSSQTGQTPLEKCVAALMWLCEGFLAEENRNFVGICLMAVVMLLSYYKLRSTE